jgi:hypothetical protein
VEAETASARARPAHLEIAPTLSAGVGLVRGGLARCHRKVGVEYDLNRWRVTLVLLAISVSDRSR